MGCINNNRISQKDFYKIFYGYAAAICNRYVNNDDELVTVVNDGFLKIYKELGVFDLTVVNMESRLKAWIKVIMIHTAIDYYRKKTSDKVNTHYVSDNIEYLTVNDETPIDKLSYYEIVEIVNQLSPVYKLVFNMSVIDGMSHSEIAKQLGISEGTSKSNLFKARQTIIKLIEKKHKQII